MLVELVEIKRAINGSYTLNTIYLNPKHIIYISEDQIMSGMMKEGKVNIGLIEGATFSRIKINDKASSSEITVVGEPSLIENKIFKQRKNTILRG